MGRGITVVQILIMLYMYDLKYWNSPERYLKNHVDDDFIVIIIMMISIIIG